MQYGMNQNRILSIFNRLNQGFIYFDNNLAVEAISLSAARILALPETVIENISSGNYSALPYLTARKLTSSSELYEAALQVLHTSASTAYNFTDSRGGSWQVDLVPDYSSVHTIVGVCVLFTSASANKTISDQLLVEKELNRTLSESSNCAIWEYNPKIKALNQLKKLNGRYSNENLLIPDYRNSVLSWNIIHPDDLDIFNAYCDSMDRGDASFDYTLRALGDIDEYIYMNFHGGAVRDSAGNLLSVVGKTTDVTNEYTGHIATDDRVNLDPLTEVLNQSAIRENIERCIDRNINYRNEVHAMLIIDIDNFKSVNDNFGHLYGDLLLENYAEMLHGFCSPSDTIGRIGGDEFLIFMKSIQSPEEAEVLAEHILKRTESGLRGQKAECRLTACIGISIYPEHGFDFDSLFKSADIALFSAKYAGKNHYKIFCSDTTSPDYHNDMLFRHTPHDEWTKKAASSFVENNIANFALDVFSHDDSTGSALNKVFREIGKFYDLSRISIMMLSPETNHLKTIYMWCNTGADIALEEIDACTDIPYDHYKQLFDERNVSVINDISSAELDPITRALFEKTGTKSLLQYAFYDGDRYSGIVNVADIQQPRIWSVHEIDTLVTVSRLIGAFLLREKSKAELDNSLFYIQSLIQSQKLTNYAIDIKTHELLYFSEYTGTLFPNIRLGQPCYREIKKRSTPCDICPLLMLEQSGKDSISFDSYDEAQRIWHNTAASRAVTPTGREIFLISQSNVTNFIDQVYSRDQLTGIPTYYRFDIDAAALLLDRKNSSRRYALLYFDITKFNFINNEWGYSLGDELLSILAETASAKLEEGELLCRIASDQFAALIKYTGKESLLRRIQRVDYIITSIFKTKYPNITIILTAGLYLFRSEDTLIPPALDKAKMAQKTVKSSHKNAIAVYSSILNRQMTREQEIEFQMHSALENNEFFFMLQPKVEPGSGRIAGAEALVRWKHNGVMLFPDEFIPIFERNGFIVELDFFVYELVFATIRGWLNDGRIPPVISINISRRHISDNSFIYRLVDLLKKYKLPASYIELELTESLVYENIDRLFQILNELQSLGFLIAIDDFGSGFSSLNLLQTLPANIIKLDKEFFLQNEMTGNLRTVVLNIIQLIKGLGMKVVCEGVETKAQADFLAENQCDMIQGYFYYKPITVSDFYKLDW